MATASAAGVTGNSFLNSLTGTTAAKPAEDPENRFLTLLVNQLKNQDPLNPMENAEVTSQLAQISTVSGIEKLNTTLSGMSGALASSQSMQASSMLGRHVIAEGDTVVYEGGTVPLSFDLAAGASHGMVTIRDAKNEVIYSKELTGLTAGRQTFNWDGTARVVGGAAKGDYTYEVSARDSSGKARVLSSGLPITYTGASVALPLNDAKGMSNLSVTVRDAAGNAVYTQALTASQSKEGVYTWKGEAYKTGNATAGDYTFQISALNAAGKRVAVEATYGYAPVESVSLADGVTVNTRGLGSVPLGKVDRVI